MGVFQILYPFPFRVLFRDSSRFEDCSLDLPMYFFKTSFVDFTCDVFRTPSGISLKILSEIYSGISAKIVPGLSQGLLSGSLIYFPIITLEIIPVIPVGST